MTTKKIGFRVRTVYRVRKPHVLAVAKQKLSFIVASVSLFAFVMGNMVGQHGWYAFWRTVFGAEDLSTIAFVGTVAPIEKVPDYKEWAKYGGSKQLHTFSQVPRDVLRDLPPYDTRAILGSEPSLAKQAYSTMWAGGYSTEQGSHAGVDIDAPRGTPIVAIANGIVEKVRYQSNGFGNHVLIRHPNVPDASSTDGRTTLYSTYAHMDTVTVTEGSIVHKGQNIGTVGNTGLVFGATGYHLYFQIDVADAPFHPYWPFTSGEIAQEGMTFVNAVNSVVFRDRLFRYTLNPMLFVEKFERYSGPVLAQASSGTRGVVAQTTVVAASLSDAERLRLSSSQRARVRMSRAGITSRAVTSGASTNVAVSRPAAPASPVPAPETPISSPVTQVIKTASVEDSSVPVGGSNTDVDHLEIRHSGKISRLWQDVTIRAVDKYGQIVESPSFDGRLHVISEFNDDVTIRPSELSPLDFQRGVATVKILTRNNKTLFIATRGAFTAVSGPMILDR